MNTAVTLTQDEKRYIESQGDPGTDFYWLAIERVIADRLAAVLEGSE